MSFELPTPEQSAKGSRDWPHAPPHRLAQMGVYMVTARFREGKHWLEEEGIRDWFVENLKDRFSESGWKLEAWAVLSNHYHFVGHSPMGEDDASTLVPMLRKLHSLTSKELIGRGKLKKGEKIWQNYRDRLLTRQESYLARLNYVHQNAVHHGIVKKASEYRWCSAGEFVKSVSPAWVKTVASFRFDEIARADGDEEVAS
ncbi:MAG: hypothetical protein Q7Q71_14895 [Verrucomicrobiota bacterium JB023]|nr:hypothetical protein [Verrucomicrobiota bacterium JB023]